MAALKIKVVPALVALAIFAVAAFVGFRLWQGPVVPAYQLEAAPLVQRVVATGRVVSTSRTQIGSEVTGIVQERRVKEGDTVKPGDVLITLRADELEAKVREAESALEQLQTARRPQAQAALKQAESQLAQATREAQRRRELYQSQSISREIKEQAEHQQTTARAAAEQARLLAESLAVGGSEEDILNHRLAAARAALAKTQIRAEQPGVVLTRNAEPGDQVQPGKVLLEIARTGDTEVLVPVDERNLGVLALGQPAICIPDAYQQAPFDASVTFIAPTIDPQKGTVDVRLRVHPVPPNLRQDMTVSANIETGRRDKALAVPNDALFDFSGDSARVWRVEQGKTQAVTVKLGLRGTTMTEILSGLSPGDWVLAGKTGQEGQRVRVSKLEKPMEASRQATRKETPVKMN